jgi:hypothetical protein
VQINPPPAITHEFVTQSSPTYIDFSLPRCTRIQNNEQREKHAIRALLLFVSVGTWCININIHWNNCGMYFKWDRACDAYDYIIYTGGLRPQNTSPVGHKLGATLEKQNPRALRAHWALALVFATLSLWLEFWGGVNFGAFQARITHFRRTVAAGWCVCCTRYLFIALRARERERERIYSPCCASAARMSFGCHHVCLLLRLYSFRHVLAACVRERSLMLYNNFCNYIQSPEQRAPLIIYLYQTPRCCVLCAPICPHECILLQLQLFSNKQIMLKS